MSTEQDQREKPQSVDPQAWWSEDDNEWMLAEQTEQGYHGMVTYWRPDGTLVKHCNYVQGQPHGPYKRYHESGEVSRQGVFVNAQIHGTDCFYRIDFYDSDASTTETFPRGLGEHIYRAEMDYEMGTCRGSTLLQRGQQAMHGGWRTGRLSISTPPARS